MSIQHEPLKIDDMLLQILAASWELLNNGNYANFSM